jgi:hypothetical protein
MAAKRERIYYFIDLDLACRQLIGWGTETKDKVEVQLTTGYHRVFLSKGQYNKLDKQLSQARSSLRKGRTTY